MISSTVRNIKHAEVPNDWSLQVTFLGKDGKVTGPAMWSAALLLMLANALIWWLYASYGYMEQGMFAAVANSILGVQALQFPKHFKSLWFYIALIFLSLSYFSFAFLMPASLPKGVPTSLFVWPVALVTIGINALIIKIFCKVFDG